MFILIREFFLSIFLSSIYFLLFLFHSCSVHLFPFLFLFLTLLFSPPLSFSWKFYRYWNIDRIAKAALRYQKKYREIIFLKRYAKRSNTHEWFSLKTSKSNENKKKDHILSTNYSRQILKVIKDSLIFSRN